VSTGTLVAVAPRALRWLRTRRARRRSPSVAPVCDLELVRLRAEVDRSFFLPPPQVW
jgi:hypothetical protein